MRPPNPDAPREAHRKYANAHGYFWMPCPRCGQYFGGHEWGGEAVRFADLSGIGCCPRCPDPSNGIETPATVERVRQIVEARMSDYEHWAARLAEFMLRHA